MGRAARREGEAAPVGMAEAERQLRVASRLYAASGGTKPWEKVNLEGQRPWVDRACWPAHAQERE